MYVRYESGYENFETIQRNTMRARLNFNEYLVQIFPSVEGSIKENLEKERQELVSGIKSLESDQKFVKKSTEYMAKLNKYEGMNLDDIRRKREEFENEIYKSRQNLQSHQTNEEKDYLQHMATKYNSYDAFKGMVQL